MKLLVTMMLILCLSLTFAQESDLPATFEDNPDTLPPMDTSADLPTNDDIPDLPSEEQSKQVLKYLEEAENNYRGILEDEKPGEVRSTERRIDSNRELKESQDSKLKDSKEQLRQMKQEYLFRYNNLKKSYEAKRIDKKTYERELERLAQKYDFQSSDLRTDVDFYSKASAETSERLKTLEEKNRINRLMLDQYQKKKLDATKKDKQRDLYKLELFAKQIKNLGCFAPRNSWKNGDIK